MTDFDTVWNKMLDHAGEEFHTVRGLPFTYRMDRETLTTSRTDFVLSRADFRTAYERMPVRGPGEISAVVRGPSYVFAILTDGRIRV